MTLKAVAIVSGGMDSVTLAYLLASQGYDLHLLGFDYGQRHAKELAFARRCAERLHAEFTRVDLTSLTNTVLRGSVLTDRTQSVPEGRYDDPTMAATIVPNRNAIMLSIAVAAARSGSAERVAIGVHAGDHPIYPDCRPQFIAAFQYLTRMALGPDQFNTIGIHAPFVELTKAQICAIGARLGVPFQDTWSCYKGGSRHCGRCGTCVERIEAFQLAGVPDPTEYEA